MRRLLQLTCLFLMTVGCARPGPVRAPGGPPRILSALEAVAVAEDFIRRGGYTEAPPEGIELLPPEEQAFIPSLHDTLQAKAFGYSHIESPSKGWMVVFCFTARFHGVEDAGQAVCMNEDGSDIGVADKDAILSAVARRLRSCRPSSSAAIKPLQQTIPPQRNRSNINEPFVRRARC